LFSSTDWRNKSSKVLQEGSAGNHQDDVAISTHKAQNKDEHTQHIVHDAGDHVACPFPNTGVSFIINFNFFAFSDGFIFNAGNNKERINHPIPKPEVAAPIPKESPDAIFVSGELNTKIPPATDQSSNTRKP
jgi:hypothetical protein